MSHVSVRGTLCLMSVYVVHYFAQNTAFNSRDISNTVSCFSSGKGFADDLGCTTVYIQHHT